MTIKVTDMVIDSLFCFDVLSNFNVGYREGKSKKMERGRRKIAKKYLKSW